MPVVEITPAVRAGDGERMLIIAGPCQIESLDLCLEVAQHLKTCCAGLPVNLVFKSSFDKANRTSVGSQRGLGLKEGLKVLAQVKERTGLPVLTDVHSAEQAGPVAEVADALQIPAFLCRQTDLLLAAGRTGRAVHVKKGQFLAPEDMRYVAEKIASTGNRRILLCERGSCFGYRDLVVDMRSLIIMAQSGYPVIFDATHSVQTMGGGAGQSSGQREFILPLARAAAAAGVAGLFFECHPDPENAPSDGAVMLPLPQAEDLIRQVCAIACQCLRFGQGPK